VFGHEALDLPPCADERLDRVMPLLIGRGDKAGIDPQCPADDHECILEQAAQVGVRECAARQRAQVVDLSVILHIDERVEVRLDLADKDRHQHGHEHHAEGDQRRRRQIQPARQNWHAAQEQDDRDADERAVQSPADEILLDQAVGQEQALEGDAVDHHDNHQGDKGIAQDREEQDHLIRDERVGAGDDQVGEDRHTGREKCRAEVGQAAAQRRRERDPADVQHHQ
jgi:hypothetical protein